MRKTQKQNARSKYKPLITAFACHETQSAKEFALYGLDKWRAMTRQWRVREKKLIILALIGGSIGAMIGMTVFHHKTRKWYFRLGIPLILGIQVSLILCFYDMM